MDTITQFEDAAGNVVAKDSLTRGLYAVGQSVVIDSKSYEVLSVAPPDDSSEWVQRVTVRDCELCPACGGIKGKLVPPSEDVCAVLRFSPSENSHSRD